jgi:hypothetical protein
MQNTSHMKKHFFIILFFAISNFVLAQQELSKEKASELSLLSKKIEGTYQVQIINSREMAGIPLQLIQTIEDKREANDTTYYWLKPNIRVMILPKNIIEKPNFKKLEQTIHTSK